jgi:hypothetical protein
MSDRPCFHARRPAAAILPEARDARERARRRSAARERPRRLRKAWRAERGLIPTGWSLRDGRAACSEDVRAPRAWGSRRENRVALSRASDLHSLGSAHRGRASPHRVAGGGAAVHRGHERGDGARREDSVEVARERDRAVAVRTKGVHPPVGRGLGGWAAPGPKRGVAPTPADRPAFTVTATSGVEVGVGSARGSATNGWVLKATGRAIDEFLFNETLGMISTIATDGATHP